MKIDAATPGLSLTPTIVILASFLVDEIPVIIWSLNDFFEFVIKVPDLDTKEDCTLMSILFSFASWIDVGCVTFEPNYAISSISS